MPVGAIAGAAVVGLGTAVVGASATKSAAKTAANASQQATNSSNALQSQIYSNNTALAQPWAQSGLRANNALNDMLGLGGGPSYGAPANDPAMGSITGNAFGASGYGGGGYGGVGFNSQMAMSGNDYGLPASGGRAYASPQPYGAPIPYNPVDSMSNMGPGGYSQATGSPAAGSSDPFASWLNSTDYNFTLGQGINALNQGYAARGTLQSGAAMKAINTYGQNHALSYLDDYMNRLQNQAGTGLSATNAVMGVGTNYANTVSANNSSNAANIANANLASGAATANLYGNAGTSIGNAIGRIYGSSYGGF